MTVKDLIDLLSTLPSDMLIAVPTGGVSRDSYSIGVVGVDFVHVFQREYQHVAKECYCKPVDAAKKKIPVLRDAVLIRDESLRYGDSEMLAENRVRIEKYFQRKLELEVQRQIDAYMKAESGK